MLQQSANVHRPANAGRRGRVHCMAVYKKPLSDPPKRAVATQASVSARASLGMIAARLATTFSASSASFAPVPLHIPVVVGAVMGTLGARVVVDLAGVEPSILSELVYPLTSSGAGAIAGSYASYLLNKNAASQQVAASAAASVAVTAETLKLAKEVELPQQLKARFKVVILETSEKGSTVVVAAMFTPRVSDMIKSTQDRASELPSLLQREAEQLTGSKYSSSILKAVDAEGDTLLINWKDGSSVKDWFVDTPGVASLVLEVERVGE